MIGAGFSVLGIIVAHLTFVMTYVIRTVGSSLARFDRSIEQAAEVLGASKARAVWEITLPILRTGLVAGGILAFIESFNDFTIAFFLTKAGMQTLPVLLYASLKYTPDPTIAAASMVQVAITMVAVLTVSRIAGVETISF
jgi:putative spermidine/putrescine transport system permease protein